MSWLAVLMVRLSWILEASAFDVDADAAYKESKAQMKVDGRGIEELYQDSKAAA